MQVFNTLNREKMEVEHLQNCNEASKLLNSLSDKCFPCLQNSSKIDETQLINSLPESVYDSSFPKMKANRMTMEDSLPQYSCSTPPFNRTRTEVSTSSSPSSSSPTISINSGSSNSLNMLIRAIFKDNKASLIEQANNAVSISQSLDRATASRLLHICCEFDSAESAAALLSGEVCGVIPLVNEVDQATGYAPLHTAAENHAVRCIELLIRKRGRTDLKTRKAVTAIIGSGSGNGGMSCDSTSSSSSSNMCGSIVAQGLLPLELSLRCVRMDTKWGPEDPLDDLLLILSEMDLRAISVLCEKTKETGEVAYAIAMEGRVAALAALLMAAADKVTGSVLKVRNHSELTAEKMTVYSCVIKEAISIFTLIQDDNKGVVEIDHNAYHGVGAKERRALLLREIELLHFFGVCHTNNSFMSKKLVSPLILACQAGDEAVMKLLLKTNIDVNEIDAEGNCALQWCLKASKVPNSQQIRILLLLLKHGARLRQKDKCGLTSVHVAAGTGKIDALEILLSRDPDSVHLTSELKETPLFLAAKNDRIDCAQLLLRFGASTEIHNLRRERPIELAKSQQMRAALNRTSLVITNRDSQQKITVQNDEVVSTREVPLKETWSSTESINSSSEGDICKYYTSATGCARGSNCFFKHGEEEIGNKIRRRLARSLALQEFKRKIFVGGLPITIDSESLASIMQEKFGPVVDAKVLEVNINGQVISRGFGFVTFTDEKSVNTALDGHYTDILGRKVEMKTAVPKCLLSHDESEDEFLHEEPHNKTVQEEMQQKISQLYSQELGQIDMSSGDNKPEPISWASRIVNDQPKELAEAHKSRSAVQDMPKWFALLKKWLPNFLKKISRNTKNGEFYSLSSLKTDFKALFGLDLDHASLGYPKLSDFIKAYPGLCASKFINTGGTVANHMILLPPPKVSCPRALAVSKIDFPALHDIRAAKKHVDEHHHKDVDVAKIESNKDSFSSSSSVTNPDATVANAVVGESTVENVKNTATCTLPATNPRFLQFLTPDPIFLARTWRGTGGFKAPDEHFRQKHLVLEHLARKKNEVFFLRGIKFYDDYAASVKRGTCVACEENRLVWANYPCQHLLWCSGCRDKAMRVAEVGTPSHQCVVCDNVVDKIDLVSWSKLQFQNNADTEFPPIHAARLRSSQKL